MKHFSKQLSWLLACMLIFTNLVFTNNPVQARDGVDIGTGTDMVVPNREMVHQNSNYYTIRYYESEDSDTVIAEQENRWGTSVIGDVNIAIKPFSWHIKYIETKNEVFFDSDTRTINYYKVYPVTSLEVNPENETMTLPEGTTLTTTTSDTINVSIYVGTTKLKDYQASSAVTLPSASQLCSDVDVTQFNSAIATTGYHLPDLTKLYYNVVLTNKSPYTLELTLAPTAEVTFNENTGTPSLSGITMYAIPNAIIDSTKLPTVSLDGKDFYGWKRSANKYVFISNVTNSLDITPSVNDYYRHLKAMYKEKQPTFKLDLTNHKVTNLLPNRTYKYSSSGEIGTNSDGEFSYGELSLFKLYSQLLLKSEDENISIDSDYVSLKHSTPNKPVVSYTATTAWVTNNDEFDGCEFAIRATSDSNPLSWGDSYEFTGLTTGTRYTISVKHKADENGFESKEVISDAFTTAVKAVSNKAPNGVTIDTIPDQTHTGSAIEPTLTITDGEKTLVKDTDYTVTYSNNINIGTATVTVTFKGEYSGTMTKNFNINHNKVAVPTISPNGGTFSGSQTVTITSGSADAAIYYTTDGTEPTIGSTVYSGPFTISSSLTVKAIAVKSGMTNSDVASASFTKRSSNSGGSSSSSSGSTYTAPTFTVTFNTDGGSTIDSKSLKKGSTIGEIPAPTKEGYVFAGWYSDKVLTKPYDPNMEISAATTLYANWTKVEPNPTDNTTNNATNNTTNELVLTIGKKDAQVFGSDQTNDVAPIIRNNRTMLPARFIAESLGAVVTWNGNKQEITIKGKNEKDEEITILININSNIAFVNGKEIKLESPAFIEGGRTFTPIRFIAERLGATVEWIEAEQKVVLRKR